MKNKLAVFLIIITGAFLYPFGCEAQVNGTIPNPESCDTVFIEDHQRDAAEAELRELLDQVTTDVANLKKSDQEKTIVISTQANEIGSLKSAIADKDNALETYAADIAKANSDIEILKSDIVVLEAALAEKPDTVYRDGEVVYRDRDSITVGGIAYKVTDIEQILPFQTVDTVDVTWCVTTPADRKYWHEGDIDTYPHFVNFATTEKGMIKVYFRQPLDTVIKKHNTLTLQRIRSHKEGVTQYDFINSK